MDGWGIILYKFWLALWFTEVLIFFLLIQNVRNLFFAYDIVFNS